MARDATVVLREILNAIDLAREAAPAPLGFDAFAENRVRRAAAERALEIISEAARHLPDAITDRHPNLPWAQIKAIGNKLRHEYHGVEPKIVWDVVAHDLGALERAMRLELANDA